VPAICRVCLSLSLVAAIPLVGSGQQRDWLEDLGSPLMGPLTVDAPFEADAITTPRLTLGDGTRVKQTTTAHYYRDRAGHVRVELLMDGSPAPRTMAERHIRTIVNTTKNAYNPKTHPERGWTFTLDPMTRTARYVSRALMGFLTGGPGGIAVPIGGVEFVHVMRAGDELTWDASKGIVVNGVATDESLGNRQIEDLEIVGRRITLTVPPRSRDDKAAEMIDERWESPDLKVLISAQSPTHAGARSTIGCRISGASNRPRTSSSSQRTTRSSTRALRTIRGSDWARPTRIPSRIPALVLIGRS
jgi:hypothetical protein